MTAPPQPRRSGALVDSSNPNISNAGLSSGRRKAINDRQRAAAEADEQWLKDLDRIHHEVWPDWGKS